MTPTPQQFVDLMNRLTHHSREMEAANEHDRSYSLGWRAATNTAIVALWAVLNGNHDMPSPLPAVENLRRVICKACQRVQFKSAADNTGCADCSCSTLSFFRRSTDIEPPFEAVATLEPFDNADHDRALCDCGDCENWRRAEETHAGA